jgi:hypothetical protein
MPETGSIEQSDNPNSPQRGPSENMRLRSLGGLLLGFYTFIGFLVLLLTHGLWYESMTELGLPPFYTFHVNEALGLWLFSIPSSVFVFIITDDARTYKSIANLFERKLRRRKDASKEAAPYIPALLNAAVISITSVCYLLYVPSMINAFSLSFTAVNAGIVAIATFYYVGYPIWDLFEIRDDKVRFEILKLEHDTTMGLANSVIWATIILIASVVFITWTQVIYPSVKDEALRSTAAFTSLQALSVSQLAYLTLGIWFGVLGRLWDYAFRIRKEIAKLGFEK